MTVQQVRWHGAAAYRLASTSLTVVVLRRGGKIASIRESGSGREWLAQPAGVLAEAGYGASFVDAEMCGWDEMAPTVTATADLPDHGEVWAVPWQLCDTGDGTLVQEVSGRLARFTLRRTIQLSEATLTLTYAVTGDGPFLWAAHPQLPVRSGSRIRCTENVHSGILVGDPTATVPAAILSGVDDLAPATGEKTWFRASGDRASATLNHAEHPTTLTLGWDPRQLPYFGVWRDNMAFSREPVVVLEPSNGWYDDLAVAAANGACLTLRPHEARRWRLTVAIA